MISPRVFAATDAPGAPKRQNIKREGGLSDLFKREQQGLALTEDEQEKLTRIRNRQAEFERKMWLAAATFNEDQHF